MKKKIYKRVSPIRYRQMIDEKNKLYICRHMRSMIESRNITQTFLFSQINFILQPIVDIFIPCLDWEKKIVNL